MGLEPCQSLAGTAFLSGYSLIPPPHTRLNIFFAVYLAVYEGVGAIYENHPVDPEQMILGDNWWRMNEMTPDKVHLDPGCWLVVHVFSGEQVDCRHLVGAGWIHVVCVRLVVCLGAFDILQVCTWVISLGT